MTNSALYPIVLDEEEELADDGPPGMVGEGGELLLYLGKVLPPAIMTVLVIYCLRETSFIQYPFGIPEIIASLLVIVLQMIRRNMYLSIVAGTVCYMILIRLF